MSSSALSFSRVVFARHYHSSTEIVLQKALKPAGFALRVRKELTQVRGMMESAESGNGTGEEFSKPRVVVKRLLSRAQPEGEGATVWRSIGRCVFLLFFFSFLLVYWKYKTLAHFVCFWRAFRIWNLYVSDFVLSYLLSGTTKANSVAELLFLLVSAATILF